MLATFFFVSLSSHLHTIQYTSNEGSTVVARKEHQDHHQDSGQHSCSDSTY
uniref:Uncharacterized protein n=1 Tax=Setaria viridis TaxID=4556 RepID=A0A4U6VBZ9_SETVI|nr:hypothetical protein SEVIR_3G063050v2 [Setaria viridis]